MSSIELLAPAGNREKLEIAIAYGADAVYFGSADFSLRKRAGNFSGAELADAIAYCRRHRVKAYLTLNFFPFDRDLPGLRDFLEGLKHQPPDALIVGDPGVLSLCRRLLPEMPLHLSTQANTINSAAAAFWQTQGIDRVNLGRELSLEDIKSINAANPALESEVFVHGAMCMAYSGRCLLSAYLTGRHANQGDCAQPCRWGYTVHEETRPGEYMALEEDQAGIHIFNAKDLCLLARLPELCAAGVTALKIEGRMKSSYYVAVVTRVYRQALNWVAEHPDQVLPPELLAAWKNELTRVSHRRYTEGFFASVPASELQYLPDSAYLRSDRFCALVAGESESRADLGVGQSLVCLQVKDGIRVGEVLEVIGPDMADARTTLLLLVDDKNRRLEKAHPGTVVWAQCDRPLRPLEILRRRDL